MLKKKYIKNKLRRRLFLKRLSCIFSFSLILYHLNLINLNRIRKKVYNDKFIQKNYYFAKKTYRSETLQIIFKSYSNEENAGKVLVDNIENRRKLNKKMYSKNIQFLWREYT